MITLSASRLILHDPKQLHALLDKMDRLPTAGLDALAPLVFDVIRMNDRSLSLMALKRIMALRPDWVNKKEEGGFRAPPLLRAVKHCCLATVNFLLDAGAQSQDVDTRGLNALDYAASQDFKQEGADQLCETLLERGGFSAAQKDSALHAAASCGNLPAVTVLLAHGASFTKITRKGTALGAACLTLECDYPAVEMVRSMLQTDRARWVIDQGWGRRDQRGAPIHCAAYKGNIGVLSLLVSAGARVNPAPENLQPHPTTPLMAATQRIRLGAIEFLINAGADGSLVDAQGQNALHHLADSNPDLSLSPSQRAVLIKAVDVLVAAGADPFAEDRNGLTPQDIALENENDLLVAHLAALTSSRDLHSGTPEPAAEPRATSGPRL